MIEMKTCTLCGETKPESEFVKHRAMKDGLSYWCKACTNQRAKEYRESPAGIYTQIKSRQKFYLTHGNPRFKPVIISREDFITWYNDEPKLCAYCDVPEDRLADFYDSYNKWSWRLSVDAKDNTVGYEVGNIVLACRRCNSLKSDILTFDEMREFAQKYIKPKWVAKLEATNSEPVDIEDLGLTEKNVEDFGKEFLKNVDELAEIDKHIDPKQTCPQCGVMHFDSSYGGCCGPTCEAIMRQES